MVAGWKDVKMKMGKNCRATVWSRYKSERKEETRLRHRKVTRKPERYINQEPYTNKYRTRVGHLTSYFQPQQRVKKHIHPNDHNGDKQALLYYARPLRQTFNTL
jgi:hypothetical protein